MKPASKWLLIAGATIAVLLIAAVVLIPLIVDVNHYKPQIEARVQETTGRSFKINGPIDLSVFPWMGLVLSDLHLGSPAGFGETDLLSVGRFEARVKVIPLLSRRIEIQRIVLEAPAIALVRKKDGRTNWQFQPPPPAKDPQTSRPETPAPDTNPAIASLTAEEIAVRNGRLTYRDEAGGKPQEIADLNLLLQDVSLDRPLQIDFSTRVNGQPVTLKGTAGPIGNPPASQPLAYDLVLSALDALDVKLKGTARDLKTQPAVSLAMDVATFSPRKIFERLGQPFPLQTADPEVLKAMAFQGNLSGGPKGVKLDAGQMTLDQSRIDLKAEAGEFDKPRLAVDARIDDIDIDRYLPPPTPAKDKAAAPASKPPASAGEKQAIDYAPLRRLVLDARLNAAKIKVNQARLQNIVLKITGRNGRFQLEPFSADLYGGRALIAGQMDVTRPQPRSDLSIELTDMLVGPFLADVVQKDFLQGRLVTAIDLRFDGDRPETIRRSLNGKGRLTFNDGAIVGIDLAGMVRNLQAAFGRGERVAEKPQTDFTELDIPFVLSDGVFRTDASNMKSPLLRLLADGRADLVQEALNFRITPKFVATLVGQGDTEDRKGVMVPILVSGSFDQPQFQPDLKNIARQQVEDKVLESKKFKKVFEENEELKPYEDQAKDLIKGLFD
jgi:AsmA protein